MKQHAVGWVDAEGVSVCALRARVASAQSNGAPSRVSKCKTRTGIDRSRSKQNDCVETCDGGSKCRLSLTLPSQSRPRPPRIGKPIQVNAVEQDTPQRVVVLLASFRRLRPCR